jgi:hypothetical protein
VQHDRAGDPRRQIDQLFDPGWAIRDSTVDPLVCGSAQDGRAGFAKTDRRDPTGAFVATA